MGKIREKYKYCYNDITIIPAVKTNIEHRYECNPFKDDMLPIFTAPMTSVVDESNYKYYESNGIIPILPRKSDLETRIEYSLNNNWAAYSLTEFENIWCNKKEKLEIKDTAKVLIDIANGHSVFMYRLVKIAKDIYGDSIIVMVGNIANPETYELAAKCGADYVRLGIGNGEGCTTSTLTAIGMPMASLISDTIEVKKRIIDENPHIKLPKIIADGGIRDFCDVIKALALGADYVMIGGFLSKLLESSAKCTLFTVDGQFECNGLQLLTDEEFENKGDGEFLYKEKHVRIMKLFYGMASKYGQNDIGSEEKVEEGIAKMFVCIGTLEEWKNKMIHAMRSAMSYLNCNDISDIYNKAEIVLNTRSAYESVNR